jgi:hypothetical protein
MTSSSLAQDIIYRRSLKGTAWHCSPACPRWPEEGFEQLGEVPWGGTVCGECKVRLAGGLADTAPANLAPETTP